jgi:hypothetical protein
LAAVGVLSGPKVMGGSRNGWRFFLFCAPAGFFSASPRDAWPVLRLLGRRWTLAGAGSLTCITDVLAVELLWTLLASKARFDFRFSKKDNSAGDSLGDSYTLGMAGTGGTSSSSSAVVELRRFRDLGAGNLEPPDALRGWIEPVDVRTVLKLVVEPTESPELYDFRFGSGVVRDEDGVEILRGSIEGDREEARTSVA